MVDRYSISTSLWLQRMLSHRSEHTNYHSLRAQKRLCWSRGSMACCGPCRVWPWPCCGSGVRGKWTGRPPVQYGHALTACRTCFKLVAQYPARSTTREPLSAPRLSSSAPCARLPTFASAPAPVKIGCLPADGPRNAAVSQNHRAGMCATGVYAIQALLSAA